MGRALPSLHALRAFEAAARLGRFNRAAEELCVTATAISHHVRHLEQDLGVQLFIRKTRAVELTASGERLLRVCTQALDAIDAVAGELRASGNRRAISLGLGPLLASRWLTPRLSRLWSAFPDLDVRLLHTPVLGREGSFDADLVIAWGDGDWPAVDATPLLRTASVPVASPELVERRGKPEDAGALAAWPLLHQRDESGWREWFDASGVSVPMIDGVVIEDANVVLQAAIDGQGAALGVVPFIAPELESGRLVQLAERSFHGSRAYYLVRPRNARRDISADDLCQWLLDEAAASSWCTGC